MDIGKMIKKERAADKSAALSFFDFRSPPNLFISLFDQFFLLSFGSAFILRRKRLTLMLYGRKWNCGRNMFFTPLSLWILRSRQDLI